MPTTKRSLGSHIFGSSSSSSTFSSCQKIVKAGDKDQDGRLDFEEFVHYLKGHEKKLRLVFKSLDKKNDGVYFIAASVLSLCFISMMIKRVQRRFLLQSNPGNKQFFNQPETWLFLDATYISCPLLGISINSANLIHI